MVTAIERNIEMRMAIHYGIILPKILKKCTQHIFALKTENVFLRIFSLNVYMIHIFTHWPQ